MSQFASKAMAILLVVLVVAPAVSPVGTASAAPDGFVGVPDTNVVDDFPVGANSTLTAADLEGSVMASDHAESMQVIVTTPERASEYVNGSRVGSGQLALVFKDDMHHAGREVAVPADAVREALGHVPKVVHGVHDDGDSWTEPVGARNGLLFFRVPSFSANAVSFEGEVSIQATAVDGSQFSPDVGSPDSLDGFYINVTGDTVMEWDNVSATSVGNGGTVAVNPAGTAAPRGPASGDPQVVLTGVKTTESKTESGSVSPSGSASISIGGNQDPESGELSLTGHAPTETEFDGKDGEDWFVVNDKNDQNEQPDVEQTIQNPPDVITEVGFTASCGNGQGYAAETNVEVYLITGESSDGNTVEGTQIADISEYGGGTRTISTSITTNGGPVTIAFTEGAGRKTGTYCKMEYSSESSTLSYWDGYSESRSGDIWVTGQGPQNVQVADGHGNTVSFGDFNDGQSKTKLFNTDMNSTSLDFSSTAGTSLDWSFSRDEVTVSENPGLDVDGDGTNEITHQRLLSPGSSATFSAPSLGLDDDTATVSTESGSRVSVAVKLREVTQTVNPSVLVNGHRTGGATVGTLADGETVELATNTSWIHDGVNNVTVAVGDGTLSADAPAPKVQLDYHHTAAVQASTTYVANGWDESYEKNHTYAGDRESGTVRIPFSRTVYDVQYVEYRVNGGSWTDVSSPNWKLRNGTELVVNVEDTDSDPSFEAGDTVAVRTAGEKVQAVNGAITVTDPTTPSDPTLDAGFRIDSWSPGFRLEVGQTYNGERVHYTYKESWDADEEAVMSADGSQTLYLPDATVGGTARVTTIPLEVSASNGDVGIHVVDPDDPELEIGPGRSGFGSDVTYKWYGATDGNRYGLYSVSRGRYLDKQDASNGFVALVDDDSEETLLIQKPGADGSNSPGGGGGGGSGGAGSGVWATNGPGTTLQEMGVVIGWAAFVVLLIAATGRSNLSGRRRWLVVGAVSAGTGLFSLEILRPGTVSGAIGSGLEEVVPLAGLAAVGLGVYSVVTWWQSRKKEAATPETKVTFDVGGSND